MTIPRIDINGTPGEILYVNAGGYLVPIDVAGLVPGTYALSWDGSAYTLDPVVSGAELLVDSGELLFDDATGDLLYEG